MKLGALVLVVCYSLIPHLLFASSGISEKDSGFPQFDVSKYFQQVFWFSVSFLLLYLYIRYYIVPVISNIKFKRNNFVSNNHAKYNSMNLEIENVEKSANLKKNLHFENLKVLEVDLLSRIQELQLNKNNQFKEYKLEKIRYFNNKFNILEKDINEEMNIIVEELYISLLNNLNIKIDDIRREG